MSDPFYVSEVQNSLQSALAVIRRLSLVDVGLPLCVAGKVRPVSYGRRVSRVTRAESPCELI